MYLDGVAAGKARYQPVEMRAMQRYPISESLSTVTLRGLVQESQVTGGEAAIRMWVPTAVRPLVHRAGDG